MKIIKLSDGFYLTTSDESIIVGKLSKKKLAAMVADGVSPESPVMTYSRKGGILLWGPHSARSLRKV